MHPEAGVPLLPEAHRSVAPGVAIDLAPVPGWVTLVQVALDAALATNPPAAFACRARWGRLTWVGVTGAPAFVELLWALEELSATLCELCGAPGVNREGWDGVVRTLCPRHAVDVTAAGPRAPEVYARAWEALGVNARGTEHGGIWNMDKTTLDAWLCGSDVPLHSPAAIASALGLPVRELSDTTLLRTAHHLRSLRFTLAVLRDIFADDAGVRRWLYTRHAEADGLRPVDLILGGRTAAAEDLAVLAWNDALTFDNSGHTVLSDV